MGKAITIDDDVYRLLVSLKKGNQDSFTQVVLAGLLMAGLHLLPVAGAAETAAIRVDDFLGSIGACSAVSRRGENLPGTSDAVKYLGLRWIRAGYESGIPVADLLELHRQTGIQLG